MTVCIGALCSDSTGQAARAAVVASDRMVTLGGLTEFEHDVPKVTPLASKAVILLAGDTLHGTRVVADLRARLPAESPALEEIAEAAARSYVVLRRQEIESQIFAPRGLTMAEFYQGLQHNLAPQLVNLLDNQVVTFNYGVDFLLAGVDESGSHLYSVGNPGGAFEDHQTIGFQAIGSGALHALHALIGFGHAPGRSLRETVFHVYAAKRRAEVAPGVGKVTDIVVIRDSGRLSLDRRTIERLEYLYTEYYQQPVVQQLKDQIANLSLLGETGDDGLHE